MLICLVVVKALRKENKTETRIIIRFVFIPRDSRAFLNSSYSVVPTSIMPHVYWFNGTGFCLILGLCFFRAETNIRVRFNKQRFVTSRHLYLTDPSAFLGFLFRYDSIM